MESHRKTILKIFFICMFLELVVFNYKHFESYFFQNVAEYTVSNSLGLEKISDETYEISNSLDAYFEITGFNVKVDNLYIDIKSKDGGEPIGERIPIVIEMTDAANKLYRPLPEIEVITGIKESKYVRLHLSGVSTRLKINIIGTEGDIFEIPSIEVNKIRPLIIRPMRVLFFLLICLLYLMFRSKSVLYKRNLDFTDMKQKGLIFFVLGLHGVFYIGVGLSAKPVQYRENDTWIAHVEYEYLADALMDGHVYLNEKPPQYLSEMENPYDPVLRSQYEQETGQEFVIDFAYYNGRYYCYFGVVPALLFFVPFKLLSGITLQTWIPVVICSLLYCASSFYFIYQLVQKFYARTSIGMYLIVVSAFIAGSQILYLSHFANVYAMPIILALLLGITGLGLWLKASRMKDMQKKYLILGAVCVALIAGCRPQLELALLFAFPIFWTQLKDKKFFSREGAGNTCAVIVPFVIVGLGLMWYNYVRFDSPFDFGANYNLTSNDMTHRGIDLYRNFIGIYEYIFQPLNIKSKYPFMEVIQLQTEYQGFTSSEPLLGGFFCMNIISVLSVYTFKCRTSMKEHGTFALAWMSLLGAAIIILFTIQMSGLTQRYMSDFGWLIMIPTVLVILDILDKQEQHKEMMSLILKIVIVSATITIMTNYFSLLAVGRYADLINMNPYLFYSIKYMFFKC